MTLHTSDIVFSTVMYKEHSVKSMKRKRTGCEEKEEVPKDLQTGSPFSLMTRTRNSSCICWLVSGAKMP
jgi:hypothetical protein